ncbi:ATP-dependent DNA helicase PIF1-like [Paramuricea clavata]|uniref:ATP-dependent DNA helicase n=1 Tax=Paramuricea clavata TaxID=317549 RepID=A0A6S7FQ49_PARCT|nr:ATP-dependent DNA helicase PIF1-like [Paramuricea clavata]
MLLSSPQLGITCAFSERPALGKQRLWKASLNSLTAKGLKCQIVCSTGISCDAYHGLAKTVHSHYRLQTAKLPANSLISRSLGRKNILLQIADTNVLIWDEVSMTSHRIFHIVNAIHHLVSNNDFPFGGVQVILVGDFWQLRSVPSLLDPGKSIISSQLLDKVFPHRFELQRVLRQGDDEDKLKHALDHAMTNVKAFLDKLINDANEDSYSQSVTSAAKYGADNLDDFELLAVIFWCRIYELFENYLTENLKVLQMTNKDFTCTTSKLQLLFLSQEYRSNLISVYNVKKWIEIDDGQRSIGALLLFQLFQLFGSEVGKRVQKEECTPICFNIQDMGPDGRGKVRYIGGWDISKCLNRARSYVIENKLSQSTNVRLKIHKEMKKINLLENYVTLPHEATQLSTANPESLRVVQSPQYRNCGLIHINDDASDFFLALEQERVDKINIQRLSSLQNDMIDDSIVEAVSNSTLETCIF